MAERIVVTEPFKTNAEAAHFVATFIAQMKEIGFSTELAPSSGGIGTTKIGLNVEDPSTGENLGNVQLLIDEGEMIIAADGNIFARRNIEAVARSLGLSDHDAMSLAYSAIPEETESGRPVLIAIVPNVE